ncbi:ATP-binding protein [Chthonobacter rhizosphaerae]|uniref:ATP-binding protein n=1 Tax=Chthonobacter rhizosphaerae TaxID=2735553 RepID=UPI001FE3DAF0|nr:ATP-binding protein [Chthonobacter rhizosphaerae]
MADLDDVFLAAAADPSVAALIEDVRPVFLFDRRGTRLLFVNAAGAEHLGVRSLHDLAALGFSAGHPTARRVAAIDGQLGPGEARTDRVPLSRTLVPLTVVCRASRFRFAGTRGLLLVVLDRSSRFATAEDARAAFVALFGSPGDAGAAPSDAAAEPDPAAEPDTVPTAGTGVAAVLGDGPDESEPRTAPDQPAPDPEDDLSEAEAPAVVAEAEPAVVLSDPPDGPPALPPEAVSAEDALSEPAGDYGADYGVEDPFAGASDPDVAGYGARPDAADEDAPDAVAPDAVDDLAAEPAGAEPPASDVLTVLPPRLAAALEDVEAASDPDTGPEATTAGAYPAPDDASSLLDAPPTAESVATDPSATAPADTRDTRLADDPLANDSRADAPLAETATPDLIPAPEPVEPSPPHTAAVTDARSADPGFVFPDHGRSVRFVFELDPALAFSFVSEEFGAVVGPAAAPRSGETWADVAARLGLDPRGRIQAALARHDTFTGLTVDWPVEGAPLRLPVDLAGMPVFGRDRAFKGYRGFGIAKSGAAFPAADRVVPFPLASAAPAPARSPGLADAPDAPLPEVAPPAEIDSPDTPEAVSNPAHPAPADDDLPPSAAHTPDPTVIDEPAAVDAALSEPSPAEPLPSEPAVSEPSPAEPARAPDPLSAALVAVAAAASVVGRLFAPARAEPSTVEPLPSPEVTGEADLAAAEAPAIVVDEPVIVLPTAIEEPESAVIGLDPDRIYAAESLLYGAGPDRRDADEAEVAEPDVEDTVHHAGEDRSEPAAGPHAETGFALDAPDAAPHTVTEADPAAGSETSGDAPDPALADAIVAILPDEPAADLAEADVVLQPEEPAQPDGEQAEEAAAPADFVTEAASAEPDEVPFEPGPPQPDDAALGLVEEPDPSEDDVAWSEPPLGEVVPASMSARPLPPEPLYRDTDAAMRQLSRPEREAFQKIAEALGARLDDGHHDSRQDSRPDSRQDSRQDRQAPAPAVDPGPRILDDETAPDGEPAAPDEPVSAPAPVPTIELSILDRLPLAVAILRQGEAVAVNRAFLELSGYPDFAALDDAGGFAEAFVGSPLMRDHRLPAIRRRDGVEVPVHVRLHSIGFQGSIASMLVVQETAKATGQMRAEAAEARVGELEAILDTATDGVLVIDDRGAILGANRSAEALFGAEREAMVGAPLIDYLAPESHRDALDYLDGLARNGVASVLNDGREVIGRVRRGGLVPLFMTVGRVSPGRFCAVLRDITQWKRAEEELTTAKRSAETASSQKSDFLAKISHEIRTPLNAIIGFSEVMMEERFGPVGSERYKEYLRDIHISGTLIMSLVNDLLDLSKIEAGKLDLSFEAVPVNEVVRECVALMQPQANRERIIIRTSLSSSLPSVVADHRSLRQIVLNLLSNAIKFNQPGGQVIVSTLYEDSGEVALRVRDTGPGMSPEDVEKALEPFRQLHTTRPGRGTGLGLPLTKALVEANRAAFRIDSALGQGTLVQVTFPSTRVLAE